MKKENIFVEFLKKIHEKWFLSTVSLVNKTKNRLIIYITSITTLLKVLSPLYFPKILVFRRNATLPPPGRIQRWKKIHTPPEGIALHPSIEVQQARKTSTCIQELRFDRWSHWFKVAARYIKGLDKKRVAYATSWTGLNPSALTTPCPSVIFNDHLCLPARKWL